MGSDNNVIAKNNISNNGHWPGGGDMLCGIGVNVGCNENQIVYNNICCNKRGFYQRYYSDNNTIHHNSFINNTQQVHSRTDAAPPPLNKWDNGYPSGGNYWSDYNGTDFYSGEYQNETGSDGIGDSPYVIDDSNIDDYPARALLGNSSIAPLVGDINYDGKVDMKDVGSVARLFGIEFPDSDYDPNCDVIYDKRIDMRDVGLVARHFGETGP